MQVHRHMCTGTCAQAHVHSNTVNVVLNIFLRVHRHMCTGACAHAHVHRNIVIFFFHVFAGAQEHVQVRMHGPWPDCPKTYGGKKYTCTRAV